MSILRVTPGAGRAKTRVLMAYATAGGGHESVALALSAALRELAGSAVEIDLLDVYSRPCSRFPLTSFPSVYHQLVRRAPGLFRAFYRAIEGPRRFALFERWAERSIQPGLQQQLANLRPDVVVRLIPGLGGIITRAIRAVDLPERVVTVITDLVDVHPGWVTGWSTAYAVATAEAAAGCAALGVPSSNIHCLGLPIGSAFMPIASEAERAELSRRLGLDPGAPTILLMRGAAGGKQLEATARALAQACPGAQVVAFVGRDAALLSRLTVRPAGAHTKVLPFVPNDETAGWMRAADLLVTKAGASTVAEASQVGLPMLLTGSLPQEDGTVRYLVERGAAQLATQPAAAASRVAQLLGDPAQLSGWRDRATALRRPSAAQATARLIFSVANS